MRTYFYCGLTTHPYPDRVDHSLLDQTFDSVKTNYVIPLDIRVMEIYILTKEMDAIMMATRSLVSCDSSATHTTIS